MTKPIRKVAVLGAGAMGSGIAAHCANAGLPVLLLDIVPPEDAIKKSLKAKPAPFFHSSHARLITTGNLDDDLDQVADCDLVIEAIIERLDIKQGLFAKLEKIIKDDTIVASNTSGLRIADMMDGRSDQMRDNFLVMHFFNPPRYMKLLELVAGPDTGADAIARAREFSEDVLGKGVVVAKDTPNFVANRIGAHGMLTTMHQMLEDGLAPEDVDAICGVPMGRPKSAVFRTADMVGVDVMALVADNCHKALTDDEERDVFKLPDYVRAMVEKKQLGNKTKGGFYKKSKAGIETLDPTTGEYRPKGGDQDIRKAAKAISKIDDNKERLRKLIADESNVGQFAWKVTSKSLAYTARRIGEITDDIDAIDDGMRWGYNWELGPFETWDALGFAATTDRMIADGLDLPDSVKKMREAGATGFYREDGAVFDLTKGDYVSRKADPRLATLDVLRKGDGPVLKNGGAEAWDLGDGVLGITFKSTANSLDPEVIEILTQSVTKAEEEFQAIVIANRGDHFCVGANLMAVVMAAGQKLWDQLDEAVKDVQNATQCMKYSRVPIVAAPFGMAVGGGLEICLASSEVQAAAETYAGLVEVGVGLVPGGGGTVNMLWRALENIPEGTQTNVFASVAQTFLNIGTAKVATSAHEGKAFGYFRHTDGVSFDRARQLQEAKARAIGLAQSGYHPPVPRAYRLPGESGVATIKMMVRNMVAAGQASDHDALIGGKLANVLCGGAGGSGREVTEQEMLDLEREAFVSLCGEPKSQERMQHMLMKNKPLRN